MKSSLTPVSIANEIRMTRSLHKGSFLVVEGDTDSRVYKKFINKKECKIIPAQGKDNALEVLKILEKDQFKGLLVIVDADFSRLENQEPQSKNLLMTDNHDLETMILARGNVMEGILDEFGHTNKIKQQAQEPIQTLLCNCALPIGLLRWLVSGQEDLTIRFRELEFHTFLLNTKPGINLDNLISQVNHNPQKSEIDKKEIKKKIQALARQDHDPWQVCCGHDMIKILAFWLCDIFGNKNAKKITAEILEGTLRLTYSIDDFKTTQLYGAIMDWQKTNPPYLILIGD